MLSRAPCLQGALFVVAVIRAEAMNYLKIRRSLDWYLQPNARPPSTEEWSELLEAWACIKPQTHPAYHPIIDDRIALVESHIQRSKWSDQ
ncbi:MAG: hypothetical protein WBG38_05240 [Nodosilinea sp.]